MMGVKNDGIISRRPHRIRPRRGSSFVAGALLLATFVWFEPLADVLARQPSATELIEGGLPPRKNLKNASRQTLLGAVCGAVRKRKVSPAAITSAAVTARRELAGDIVGAVLRCSGTVDCELVGSVVSAAIQANGNVITISDTAIGRAPNCAESIQRASRPRPIGEDDENERTQASSRDDRSERTGRVSSTPARAADVDRLIGTSAGANEGFDPLEALTLVCDNGTQRALRVSLVDEFLRAHPGAVKGDCPRPAPHPGTPAPSATIAPRPTAAATAKPESR